MIDILQEYGRALLWSDGYQITGLAMTLWLLITSVLFGGLLAIVLAIGRTSRYKWLSAPIWLYTYLWRGTPLYIQLLIIYTGLYTVAWIRNNPVLSEFFQSGLYCTMLAFTLSTCAYTTEILAGAIRNVPAGQIDAAKALGFNRYQIYRWIILPSAFRLALPSYSNEVIMMLHSTALAFTATVPDILKVTRDINAETYQPFVAFSLAAILYAMISSVLIYLFRKLEKHWQIGQQRR